MAPDQLMFDHELGMYLMWVDGVAIVHVVDTHTPYSPASVLRNKTAGAISDAFIECWVTLFIGLPRELRLDQEAGLTARAFFEPAMANELELQFSGLASHNSIGVRERYYAPLRRELS